MINGSESKDKFEFAVGFNELFVVLLKKVTSQFTDCKCIVSISASNVKERWFISICWSWIEQIEVNQTKI